MKILVTGASGFIGGTIVQALAVNNQNEIWATGRSHTSKFDHFSNVSYFQQDLSEHIPDQTCEVCVHCAGLADDNASREQFERHNVTATKNLTLSLSRCRIVIYISSSSVYDFSDGKVKYEEDAQLNSDLSFYGRSKLLAEDVVRGSRIPSVYILRPRAVYGQGDRVLLPRILELIRWGRMILPSNISSKSSMTNIQNLNEVVLKCMDKHQSGIHIFNVADQPIYNLKTVFGEILLRKTGRKGFVFVPGALVALAAFLGSCLGGNRRVSKQSLKYITEDSVLSVKKAKNSLGYTGQYEFYSSMDQLNI